MGASLLIPLGAVLTAFFLGPSLSPGARLFASTIPLLLALKLHLLLSNRLFGKLPRAGIFLYLFVWPGMEWESFKERSAQSGASFRRVALGFTYIALGTALLLYLVENLNLLSTTTAGLGGIAAILLIVHFGYSEILTQALRHSGWNVNPLFRDPFLSLSLGEFWGRRWNLPFVEMNRLIFLPIFRTFASERIAIFLVFIVSGLLHEFAISVPAAAGWGGPLLYFLLHGVLTLCERSILSVDKWPTALRRVWTFGWLFIPLPMLFHTAFRETLVLPFLQFLHEAL